MRSLVLALLLAFSPSAHAVFALGQEKSADLRTCKEVKLNDMNVQRDWELIAKFFCEVEKAGCKGVREKNYLKLLPSNRYIFDDRPSCEAMRKVLFP